MYYFAALLPFSKHNPGVSSLSVKMLNMIDAAMREVGVEEYDLGIVWAERHVRWAAYAIGTQNSKRQRGSAKPLERPLADNLSKDNDESGDDGGHAACLYA